MDEPDGAPKHRAILEEILVTLAAFGAGESADFDDPAVRMDADELMAEPTIQVIRLAGGIPEPASCDFGTPWVHLDHSDLGDQAPWYAPVRPRRSPRGGRPDRPSRKRR